MRSCHNQKHWLCESICAAGKGSNICYGHTVTLCVSHKERYMEGQEQGEGERIDECGHSGRAGERWRALFFSLLSFLSVLRGDL